MLFQTSSTYRLIKNFEVVTHLCLVWNIRLFWKTKNYFNNLYFDYSLIEGRWFLIYFALESK